MHDFHPIIDFWFGSADRSDSAIADRQGELWWGKKAATDAEIRRRFGPQVLSAAAGELDDWKKFSDGWLALILLLDQFPRNIFRDSPAMFGFDDQARALCAEGLEAGIDGPLRLIRRVFFYLPLEHSESADDQAWCVDLMRGLARAAPESDRSVFEGFVDYAEAHKKIIDRFGRFPHRNRILGRQSSSEELEFLKQPGSSF